MYAGHEKNWFDANEVASMARTVRRCSLALGDVEPTNIALNVLRCFGAGETNEERVVQILVNRYRTLTPGC
jgi:hypothetical protein